MKMAANAVESMTIELSKNNNDKPYVNITDNYKPYVNITDNFYNNQKLIILL